MNRQGSVFPSYAPQEAEDAKRIGEALQLAGGNVRKELP